MQSRICIIGAGWNGVHTALKLKSLGYDVVIYEKNPDIFSEVSGHFGIRLHEGQHYPRSFETRKNCRESAKQFKKTYPELVISHESSIYALGKLDADGNLPKVNEEEFTKVCFESKHVTAVNLEEKGFQNLYCAFDIEEPSIALGNRLRKYFWERLNRAQIPVKLNYQVTKIAPRESSVYVGHDSFYEMFDKVINTTGYTAFCPLKEKLPFDMDVIYQPCLALVYKEKNPTKKPRSFIVMDGWFPCLMPCIDSNEGDTPKERNYILTHGKWTILGSYKSNFEAKQALNSLNDTFVEENIRAKAHAEMLRFWPDFDKEFEYVGWKGEALAKIRSRKEFRSAVTFEQDNIIHVIPGKVSNIFDVEKEIKTLMNPKGFLEDFLKDASSESDDSFEDSVYLDHDLDSDIEPKIIRNGKFSYVKNGILDSALSEIEEKPLAGEPNTGNLQTFTELLSTPKDFYKHSIFHKKLKNDTPINDSQIELSNINTSLI
jgi:hypothetical protein